MRTKYLTLVACVLLSGLMVTVAHATVVTVTLQNGANAYAGTHDTFIDGTTGLQTTNNGANSALWLYEREIFDPSTDLRVNRVLMRFDLSSLQINLAQGQTITGATLTITSQGYQGFGNKSVANSLYRVTAADVAWADLQATWQKQTASTPWAGGNGLISGTDYVATALDTQNTPNIGGAGPSDGSTMTFTLNDLSFLPGWINNPSTNAGFFIRQPTGTGAFDKFYSSDASTVAFRPLLTITLVPEPASFGLLSVGALLALRRRRRD
jgi:hypothetical protein